MLMLLCIVLGAVAPVPQAEASRPGPLMLVGGVLSLKDPVVWRRIADLVGGEVVVIAAANSRPRLYGSYAVRGLARAGLAAHLLPIALSADEFGRHHREATRDPEIVARIQDSSAVFFVGGAPQHLAEVLFEEDGSPTPVAAAIVQLHADGGMVIGGIPERLGAHTGIDAWQILERGALPAEQLYRGLGLMAAGWYLDHHLFLRGRLAEALVAMRQHELNYGVGIAPNVAALIDNGRLEVIGDGIILLDLSRAITDATSGIFNLRSVRLSYLGDGDRIDLATARVIPHPDKLDGFEIRPGAADHAPMLADQPANYQVLNDDQVVQHILLSLEGESKQALGFALRNGVGVDDASGFQFRYHAAEDTMGWLAMISGEARYTALNVHLDILPLTRAEAARLVRERRLNQSLEAPSVKIKE